jgi:hypothetical protein
LTHKEELWDTCFLTGLFPVPFSTWKRSAVLQWLLGILWIAFKSSRCIEGPFPDIDGKNTTSSIFTVLRAFQSHIYMQAFVYVVSPLSSEVTLADRSFVKSAGSVMGGVQVLSWIWI